MNILIPFGKKIKRLAKTILTPAPILSYARRIDGVRTDKRVCAMTFDDGPTHAPLSPCNGTSEPKGLTSTLLDALKHYNAFGTFDIIGSTADNYPDRAGKTGTPQWSGERFDHYPSFGNDSMAGAVSCPDLVKRIIEEGHELSNHGYRHIIFGKKNVIYRDRVHLEGIDEVCEDIKRLNDLVKREHSYSLRFMRPAHYVDNIKGGFSSYDAIGLNSMLYLGASFDGAGWLPANEENEAESYRKEVEACVAPLKAALEKDPDALCGKIIFQKDGYNMALRTPVADALPLQLEILQSFGYRVVTVSELMRISPFSDISEASPYTEAFKTLSERTACCYSDNTVRPELPATRGDLIMMVCDGKEALMEKVRLRKERISPFKDVTYRSEYCGAASLALKKGFIKSENGLARLDSPAFEGMALTRGQCAEKVLRDGLLLL